MAHIPNEVLVIDVEATCWDGHFHSDNVPQGQRQEIIEIGIAVVNNIDNSIEETESILVVPTHSEVSEFCTELTGLTEEELARDGLLFKNAINTLRSDFNSWDRPFVSWGDFDRNQFRDDCDAKNVGYPFSTHMNLKTIDSWDAGLKNEKGMKTALNRRDIELEGDHHSGVDDAFNTAKIFLDIFQ